MRLFPKKSSQRAPARRTLEAAVARRASRSQIEEEEEPTTSFKTALVVVLLLHIVAGCGILMFDRIKTRRLSTLEPTASTRAVSLPLPVAAAPTPARPKPQMAVSAPVEPLKKSLPVAPVASAPPAAHAMAPVAEVKKTGTTYTVAKGDLLSTIAKKLHVNYDDLLKLNKIDNPKKLRVGQKLLLPVKARAAVN